MAGIGIERGQQPGRRRGSRKRRPRAQPRPTLRHAQVRTLRAMERHRDHVRSARNVRRPMIAMRKTSEPMIEPRFTPTPLSRRRLLMFGAASLAGGVAGVSPRPPAPARTLAVTP